MRPIWLFLLSLLFVVAARGETKSVRDFGASGDGVSDDTASIQKAVASGAAVFPKGIYRLTRPVEINLDQNGFASLEGDGTARIVMAGAGPAFHFIGTHASSADPWNVRPEVWERQRMPVIRGIEIVGENPEADGIEASGTMQLTIAEMLIRHTRHAIRLTQRDRNVMIADCHLYDNHGCGVFFDHVNLHQTNIVGCHISYNAGGGVVSRGGELRNLQIGTCDIESNMTPDAPPTANILIDSTDGSTAEVAVTGCTLQHNSKSPGSANLRFLGRGVISSENHDPTQEGHLVVTGNVFSDVMVNVDLHFARGVSIMGNSFWEGFEHNIVVEDSSSVVIGPNDFDRNPRYVVNHTNGKERNGIVLRRCADTKLEGFVLKEAWHDPAALLLEECTRCTVQDCSILDCDGVGLVLKNCAKSRVSGCVIRDDRAETGAQGSLLMDGGADNWISGNWLANGAKGLSAEEMQGNRR